MQAAVGTKTFPSSKEGGGPSPGGSCRKGPFCEVTPAQQVAQVELPGPASSAKAALHIGAFMQCSQEGHHLLQAVLGHPGVQGACIRTSHSNRKTQFSLVISAPLADAVRRCQAKALAVDKLTHRCLHVGYASCGEAVLFRLLCSRSGSGNDKG